MNNVSETGRLADDIRINQTNGGKSVGNGTIAVQRNFKNSEGKYDVDWIDFVAWGPKAGIMAEYMKKGDKIGITGWLQTRFREKDNVKFKVTEVNVQDFDFPDKPKQDNQQQQNNQPPKDDKDPFAENGEPVNISSEDLPF